MKTSEFSDEDEIQLELHRALLDAEGLWELVENSQYLDGFTPADPAQRRIFESFDYCRNALHMTEIISANENISLKAGEILKPDFVLYAPEGQSIAIVELKNQVGASRQAGTELSAYAAEVKSYLPFLSDGDLLNVIISTQWPTLLRHYIAHEIFWMQRNIVCLTPKKHEDGIRLEILDIPEMVSDIRPFSLHPSELGGYQLCLYDNQPRGPEKNRDALDIHLPQMRAALMSVQAIGEAHKSQGFAFLWKDKWEKSLAPYSITFANVASFQGLGKLLNEAGDLDQVPEMAQRFMRIVQEHDPYSHGQSLSRISDSAKKMVGSFCSPVPEGFLPWGQLGDTMYRRSELISFVGWGYFRELFMDFLERAYASGKLETPTDCPALGTAVVETIIDPNIPFINLMDFDMFIDGPSDE